MENKYSILGLNEDATDAEIDEAYKKLRSKYLEERFLEGELGNSAAKKLTKIEEAYSEIILERRNKNNESGENMSYSEIEKYIKNGQIDKAQSGLDEISERDAEWHYLQAVVFYKKNWVNESKKQLEIAVSMDPFEIKYSEALSKIKQRTEFNEQNFNNNYNQGQPNQTRQMGATDSNDCLSFCTTWCCMNMLFNLCCGCR